jgi:ABC-type antimicrobial peptide transport system permease subunit
VGLYGVLAAMVAARRREIGVRSALGAAPSAIMRRVLGTGLAPVVAGTAIGSLGAVAASRLLSAHLYGIPPFDSRSFLQAAGVLVAAGLLAAFIPAYRATQVSPVEVLRED